MENVHKMIDLADAEFGTVAKSGKFRSREEIDSVYKLMDIVKDAMCIEDMMNGNSNSMGGYSNGMSYGGMSNMPYMRGYGMGYGGMSYGDSYGNSYGDGNSYARGNQRRDSMGRYSGDGNSYRGDRYSRDGEGGKKEYINNLRNMMNSAPDEATRQGIQRMIEQMEHN